MIVRVWFIAKRLIGPTNVIEYDKHFSPKIGSGINMHVTSIFEQSPRALVRDHILTLLQTDCKTGKSSEFIWINDLYRDDDTYHYI